MPEGEEEVTCQHVTGECPGDSCPCRPKTPCIECGTWPAINREPSRCNACQAVLDALADLDDKVEEAIVAAGFTRCWNCDSLMLASERVCFYCRAEKTT